MAKKELPPKLNICLVAAKFPILGRASDHGFLWPIARGMAKKGHKVTVLSWKNPEGKREIVQDDIHAYFLGEGVYQPFSQFPLLVDKKFSELHQTEPFHIIHSIDSMGLEAGRKRKKYGVMMAYDVEATQMSQLFSILGMSQETLGGLLRTGIAVAYKYLTTFYSHDRPLLKTADAMFVTSPQQKIVLERYYLYPEYRTYTVPYGIEIGDLSPREKSGELRNKLGIPGSAHVVVAVTDMTELEEMRNLLRAFEKLAIKKPSSRLIVVGNGPLKKDIEFEMLNLALGSKVIFSGAVSNTSLPDYIALADVFVNLSARTTGFEPSILEAMAQSKVIIGSEVSPIATIVENGKDGFLVRPADIQAISSLFIKICAEKLPSEQIGENARNKVMNLFDTDKMVAETIDAYYATLVKSRQYKKPRLEKVISM